MKKFSFDAKKTVRGKFKPSTAAEQIFGKQLRKVADVAGHIVEIHTDGVRIIDAKEMMDKLARYAERLGPWARRQSKNLLDTVKNSNKRAYQNKSKAIGAALKLDIGELAVESASLRLMNEQVTLIKSIPLEAGLRAQKIAYEAAAFTGVRASESADKILEYQKQMGDTTEVTRSRAVLIARTETARANAVINQSRAQAVGSGQYRWHNSGDGAVRESHKTRNGKPLQGEIFSWDDPPVLDDGTRGHPGTFPNCRCFAEPVFDVE
jgi:SPP1 gp7 family putative phage head morphogenesis protein